MAPKGFIPRDALAARIAETIDSAVLDRTRAQIARMQLPDDDPLVVAIEARRAVLDAARSGVDGDEALK